MEAKKCVKLQMFEKFKDTTDALASAAALIEGKMSKGLKKVMKKVVAADAHEKLAVADAKLGSVIKKKFELDCVYDSNVQELMRCIRSQLGDLIQDKEMTAMSLGLAHSLSRYKLKFSPDKIDTMIVQAVSLLDDLDKELNNYIMRCREWYGWHFPEIGKIITDNLAYVRTVEKMGTRDNAEHVDLSDILPEDVEERVKEAAEISMGTEISQEDITNINHLCEQIVEMSDYRGQLYDYIQNRMVAVAPNLTVLVGELVGARLISHAGSLMNLAKHPASTVQILGAEKALFKALKTKHDTPKYGLIYHASLVGQAGSKLKGKVSRMLAAKASLGCRVDALCEMSSTDMGVEHRAKVESRIRQLESGNITRISGTAKQAAKHDKYDTKSEVVEYKSAADVTSGTKRPADQEEADQKPAAKKIKVEEVVAEAEEKEKKKKKKKDKKEAAEAEAKTEEPAQDMEVAEVKTEGETETPKKKKKKGSTADADTSAVADSTMEAETTADASMIEGEEKKKKIMNKQSRDKIFQNKI